MKKISFIIFILFLFGVCTYGEEVIDGKKVFSPEEIIEKFNGGKDVWNIFRAENPQLDFGILFKGVVLKKADYSGMNLTNIDFTGSNMAGTNFEGSDFSDSILKDVNFYNANLKRANFLNCETRGANFDSAALFQANFENTIVYKKWRDEFKKKDVKKYGTINWR